MKVLTLLILFIIPTLVLAHPGGGLVVIDTNTVVFGDSTNNAIWRLKKGKKPYALMSKFHAHWTTLGLDGHIYSESFQQMGGALFRIDLSGSDHLKIAEEADVKAQVFAIGMNGEIIFQKGGQIVQRDRFGVVKPFRGNGRLPGIGSQLPQIIAYAWDADGALYLAAGNVLMRVRSDGVVRVVAVTNGELLEPKIWNSIGAPRIWSISIDYRKRVYTALPDVGQVVRIDTDGSQHIIDRSVGGWRVTAVATYRDSVFLLESSDKSNAGQRVRVIRGSAKAEIMGQVEP